MEELELLHHERTHLRHDVACGDTRDDEGHRSIPCNHSYNPVGKLDKTLRGVPNHGYGSMNPLAKWDDASSTGLARSGFIDRSVLVSMFFSSGQELNM